MLQAQPRDPGRGLRALPSRRQSGDREILGEIKGPLLQSLLSWKGLACDLPSSQALLFWVRETLPDQFHSVLARVKVYA